MNDKIRATEVRLVGPDGSQVGIKTRDEALWLARQLDMDLVEVAPDAAPPVCRIMDFGKHKYEQSVRDREARKKSTKTVIKEVKFRPKIDNHDYEFKRNHATRFLKAQNKVKATVMFRGREVTHPEIGRQILEKLREELSDISTVERSARLEGYTMTMILAPLKD